MTDVYVGDLYRHFKGNIYLVVDIFKHHDTLEPWVAYRNIYTNEQFIRPQEDFTAIVNDEPRFQLVDFEEV